MFKTLFLRSDDDLKEYFNRILSWALKRDVRGYVLGPKGSGIVSKDNIENKVDILLVKGNEKIDIELNNASGEEAIKGIMNKSMVYLTYYVTIYYDENKKEKYKKPIKVEQVKLNNFYSPDLYLVERLDFRFTDTTNKITMPGIEHHHIYLPRMKEICYSSDEVDEIYKDYAMLLCETYEEMEELAGCDAGRKSLVNLLKQLGRDEEVIGEARRREDDLIIASIEGEEKGK